MEQISSLMRTTAMYDTLFEKNGDRERVDKLQLFIKKLQSRQFTIGFAGHFSAGKSSMINALTGDDLLPSSPIPTSANIVNVQKSDENYVILHQTDGRAIKYKGHDFTGAIKAFGKNGEEVARIDIGHVESNIPKGVTVMDTPGVDSTDDAHALSTESALHLSDIVFYTMDYNHVQSELNFTFTKELMAYNPNVYLIVNQVDKHRDEELSFDDFKKSVEESFATWGVHPKGIFFTSLRAFDLPYNDFTKVKAIVDVAMRDAETQFITNSEMILQKLHDEHVEFLQRSAEKLKEETTIVEEEEWTMREELEEQYARLRHERSLLSSDAFQREFEAARSELVESAAITPFEMREQLKDYLESKNPNFKVGLLFAKKKTEEERLRRRDALSASLSQLIDTQIIMHLRTLMKRTLNKANLLTDEETRKIDSMLLDISFDEIDEVLHAPDVITGDTVLNYTKQVRNRIEVLLRQKTDAWKQEMAKKAESVGTEATATLDKRIATLGEKVTAVAQYDEYTQALQSIDQILERDDLAASNAVERRLRAWSKPIEYIEIDEFDERVEEEVEEETILESGQASTIDADQVVDIASQIAERIGAIEQLAEWETYLKSKAERIRNHEFTVALFGAFSAGKSSFSNALIGNKALPVSPNPTTAAINRIRPTTEEKQHEHADVHVKTRDIMLEDVGRSYEMIGMRVTSLEEAYEKADEALAKPIEDERLHLHKSFIRAYQKGYPTYHASLGEVLYVDKDEFSKFVAEEHRSCFVDSIDFYFNSPLTRQGVTLVDTPGADSINARHTDVAFEYIRNADAILFVTYYNHAFARADREFLIQLGRVKDAFEMDKMFFIVNAIDLASSDEEAEQVKSYVRNELTKLGIRHPRVYGVSSLEALQAKERGEEDSNMAMIEGQFYSFLQNDLKGMAAEALQTDSENVVSLVREQIERAEANIARKGERLIELRELEEALENRFEQSFEEVYVPALTNEVKELLYYVKQRVFLRFPSFLRESYNPIIFAKHSKQEALKMALTQMTEMIRFDFVQELRVTNLRVGKYVERIIKERQRSETEQLLEMDHALKVRPYEMEEYDMLHFDEQFQSIAPYEQVNRHYKNESAFFEKGGRDTLGQALQELLEADAETYMQKENDVLYDWAFALLTKEARQLYKHLHDEAMRQVKAQFELLEHEDQIEEWKDVYEQLEEVMK